jgi:hypothetical protein
MKRPTSTGFARFTLFHAGAHPRELGEGHMNTLLTHLAVKENVAASTQNEALAALPFLYGRVLVQELLGHKDAQTTMIYTHVLNSGGAAPGPAPEGCGKREREDYAHRSVGQQAGGDLRNVWK